MSKGNNNFYRTRKSDIFMGLSDMSNYTGTVRKAFFTFVALEWFAFEMTAIFYVYAQFLRRREPSATYRTFVTDIAFLKKKQRGSEK